MKNLPKLLFVTIALVGLQFWLSSCGLRAAASGSIYYGPQREAWFRDDPWVDGQHWQPADPNASVGVYFRKPRNRP